MKVAETIRAGSAVALAAVAFGSSAGAADSVSGLITRTFTIVEDTELTGDVVCQVAAGTPCFAFGASGISLGLNGFTITGPAHPATGCGGALVLGEQGISTAGFNDVYVHGPGLVQRFRTHGVAVLASRNARVDAITAATNCGSGVFVNAASFDTLVEGVTSVRNGSTGAGATCGGI
jgi:hypothetical protein